MSWPALAARIAWPAVCAPRAVASSAGSCAFGCIATVWAELGGGLGFRDVRLFARVPRDDKE